MGAQFLIILKVFIHFCIMVVSYFYLQWMKVSILPYYLPHPHPCPPSHRHSLLFSSIGCFCSFSLYASLTSMKSYCCVLLICMVSDEEHFVISLQIFLGGHTRNARGLSKNFCFCTQDLLLVYSEINSGLAACKPNIRPTVSRPQRLPI